jgi:subtilisin family serine protease
MRERSNPSLRSEGRRRRGPALLLAAAAASAIGAAATVAPAGAAGITSRATAAPLVPGSLTSAPKYSSSDAKTDQALLHLRGTALTPVVVKLDYAAIASYRGGVAGYAATSPAATGQRKLNLRSANVVRYAAYAKGFEDRFVAALQRAVPAARVGISLRTVYGGLALRVPANRIADVLRLPGVVAVQSDEPEHLQTDSSPGFIGAPTLWNQLGGQANAGRGVIVGDLDSGAWPEHPSFADNGLSSPPAKADGTPRTCDFGDNPLTPASDPFQCNNKLISGQAFLATYNALQPPEVYSTARDSDGHGTHTASTAAGDVVASAPLLGIDRGPVTGIAPGAWLAVYKVCGATGCYPSDTAAAVQQAIKDGVDVINFSISGGSSPFTDVAELSFLDAYASGIVVSASAGNSGPGAGTVDHRSPWVITVGASTQAREFTSMVTLSAGGDTLTVKGASITPGVSTPRTLVSGSAAPYNDVLCSHPAPPGVFSGKVVICQRSPGRVLKGFNVVQGGAAGMLLINPTPQDVETDSHWLPTVHLDAPDGTSVTAFLASHPGATVTFTQGAPEQGVGDVVANFSSRGPGGPWIKPDVTAPGVSILAGQTPTPEDPSTGPPGQYYQAIAGTSMAAPHVTGAAALLRALHPSWSPGQVKSALMTTAKQTLVLQDGTPAGVFDRGAGRIDLTRAGDPGVTFSDTAEAMFQANGDTGREANVNIPSVDVTTVAGSITVTRTATNVTTKKLKYKIVTTSSSPDVTITVTPRPFQLRAGQSKPLSITIDAATAAPGQYTGSITLQDQTGSHDVQIPVAFVRQAAPVTVSTTCTPTSLPVGAASHCDITATNTTLTDTTIDVTAAAKRLNITGTSGGLTQVDAKTAHGSTTLAGGVEGVPTTAPGVSPAGYLPLDLFGGTTVTPIGDEQQVQFDIPPFLYDGQTYTHISVDANGYIVVGGTGAATDNNCCDLTQIPDPAPPNNILAPFWTDLDGGGAPGILANVLTDGTNTWTVIEWRVNVFGTSSRRNFQVWLGTNGVQDLSYAYDPATLQIPFGQPFLIGAENQSGTGGNQLPLGALPTSDLVVTSTEPSAGESKTFGVDLVAKRKGAGSFTSSLTSPLIAGTAIDVVPFTIAAP